MDFQKLSKIGLETRWKKQFSETKQHIINNNSKFSGEKARIIGFIMGDGSINSSDRNGHHHDIRFYPDNLRVAKIFMRDFEYLYLKKPKLKKLKNYFSLHISSKPAWEDLRKIGDFSSLKWEFPKILFSEEEKIEWLKAIFDCEAYVNVKKKNINFQTVSKKGIISIQNLLKELGIESKIYPYKRNNPKWNINYLLFIWGKANIYNFAQRVGFNHSLKKKKLKNISRCARTANGRVSKTRVRKDF